MLLRRDARLLRQDERDALVVAFKDMHRSGDYLSFATVHDAQTVHVHNNDTFLPWHRAFLIEFEKRLAVVTGQSLALPYWNWAEDALLNDPKSGEIWGEDFLGGIGSDKGYIPNPNNGVISHSSAITSGNFANWPVLEGQFLTRAMGRERRDTLSTPIVLKKILRAAQYESILDQNGNLKQGFRQRLEHGPHAWAHNWVGGTMRDIGKSPGDPSFWLLHGFADLLFERWIQICNMFGRDFYPYQKAATKMYPAGLNGTGVYTPKDLHRVGSQLYQYDMLSFKDSNWDSLATFGGKQFYAAKNGFIMIFRPDKRGKFKAIDRCPINQIFYDLPEDFLHSIDAMTRLPNGRIVLTKGNRVVFYPKLYAKPLQNLAPKTLSDFLQDNRLTSIDSICVLKGRRILVSKGNACMAFTQNGERLSKVSSAPKRLAEVWRGLDWTLSQGFDAATQSADGTVIATRGQTFIRYTAASWPASDGNRPKAIYTSWFVSETDLVTRRTLRVS